MKVQLKNHWTNFLINETDRKGCARRENFKFSFYSGIFSTTFRFKYVLNILLF
jgi:hypothetical protein